MLVAGVSDDRLVVVSERQIEVRDMDGRVLQTRSYVPVSTEDGFLECVENRCVTGDGDSLFQFDADDLTGVAPIVVRQREHPDPIHWIQPYEVRVACDGSGACLATWSLFQETRSDSSYSFDFLGNFARPFSLSTGILGAEIRLEDPRGMQDGPLVASIAPGAFVVWVGESTGFILHRVDVQ